MTTVDDLKARMLAEFEAGIKPDIAAYVREAPEARETLLDYWVILVSSTPLAELGLGEYRGEPRLDAIEQEAVRDLCLAASLGPEWLKRPDSETERQLASIGAEMERLRGSSYSFRGKAPVTFRRIAVYGWITGILSGDGGQGVSRMRAQKVAYLLENGLQLGVFRKHTKYRFGPYDPSLTYRDAEPECLKKGYLVRGADQLLRPGPKHSQAASYAAQYVRQEVVARALIDKLRRFDECELETLTTVHSVCSQVDDREITPDTVVDLIKTDDAWRAKLRRENFTVVKINEALKTLSLLRLV